MRLWSIHPCYLDTKGLVACWREGLLARKVLCGETTGYRRHPQLQRFKQQASPVALLDAYLLEIYNEATRRGFAFNREKIGPTFSKKHIAVTDSQLAYEFAHLKRKLKVRDRAKYICVSKIPIAQPHPLFHVMLGNIEPWEKLPSRHGLAKNVNDH